MLLTGQDETDEPTPQKRPRNDIIGYLKEKNQAESDFRKQELELRREEIKLEKEKFELERQERKQRLDTEQQEKTLMLDLLKKCLACTPTLNIFK